VRVAFSTSTMSTVGPGALVIFSLRYRPSPSWVMPRITSTPSLGMSSPSLSVLFWPAKMACDKSLPTLSASMSNAALNSMSRT
jgi:hypothetical protein